MIIKVLGILSERGIRKVKECLKDALELKYNKNGSMLMDMTLSKNIVTYHRRERRG